MTSVNYIEAKNIIEYRNSINNSFAIINLNLGGSLEKLQINGEQILADMQPISYETCYNSAILFPFVNRIDNGKYIFNKKEYQFKINEPANNNALHGLVYNKKFVFEDEHTRINSTSITLSYTEKNKNPAFPYLYKITLIYTFSNTSVTLEIKIDNIGTENFPFTVGWHPYFYSKNLSKSTIKFNADKKVIHNQKMITKNLEATNISELRDLESGNYDDCFSLRSGKVIFETPTYNFTLNSNLKENYLQIYTPENKNAIAIEPITGISDSFNNKVGLQLLKPNTSFSSIYTLSVDI